jgi:hypothetical protein
MGIFSGWGWTTFPEGSSSKQLQKINLKIISNIACDKYFIYDIRNEQLCTLQGEGVGICFVSFAHIYSQLILAANNYKLFVYNIMY